MLETDLYSSCLRFSIFLKDIDKIPRNHLRLVQWQAFLVRKSKRWPGLRDPRQQLEMVELCPGIEYSHYYVQEDTDTGVMMETMVPTKDVKDGVNEFLEEGYLRLRIVWKLNLQLFQSTYHQYDEVYRFQREQMVRDFQNQSENSLVNSTNSVFHGNGSIDDLNNLPVGEVVDPAQHGLGRRVSSLGDEIYYVTNKTVLEQKIINGMHHQQSLESFQLNKERIEKIREKQANMSGWTGMTPPIKLGASYSPRTPPRVGGSMTHLGGSLPKLSSTRISTSKLNTIQLGLASVLNPETYVQQQKKIMPFIPGANTSWLSRSQEESLFDQDNHSLENSRLLPLRREVASTEDLEKSGTARKARPKRLLGIYKCQSFNC